MHAQLHFTKVMNVSILRWVAHCSQAACVGCDLFRLLVAGCLRAFHEGNVYFFTIVSCLKIDYLKVICLLYEYDYCMTK